MLKILQLPHQSLHLYRLLKEQEGQATELLCCWKSLGLNPCNSDKLADGWGMPKVITNSSCAFTVDILSTMPSPSLFQTAQRANQSSHSNTVSIPSIIMHQIFDIPVQICYSEGFSAVSAWIDSGVAGNFSDHSLSHYKPEPDNSTIHTISCLSKPLIWDPVEGLLYKTPWEGVWYRVSSLHQEQISLLISHLELSPSCWDSPGCTFMTHRSFGPRKRSSTGPNTVCRPLHSW